MDLFERPALHMTKEECAKWLGYAGDIEQMDKEHDRIHQLLTECWGKYSYSLAIANSLPVTYEQWLVANMEEEAVLHIQRWLTYYRKMQNAAK